MKKLLKSKGILPRLIFFAVLIVANTFGWFIYITRVDNNVSVHVKSWDVVFQSGDKEITNTVQLDIDSLYPGMEDYNYEINAYNKSEVSATFSYTILEANILGEQYTSIEQKQEAGEEILPTDKTSAELETMFRNDFPFSMQIDISTSTIEHSDGNALFSITVVWPYENDNDTEDTRWGIAASNYKKANPDKPSITMKIKIQVIQNNE